MTLDAAGHWAGVGAVQGRGDTAGAGWGEARVGGGFLKIALEDFIEEFLWVGGDSKLPEPLGSFRSFSSGKFFSLFNI